MTQSATFSNRRAICPQCKRIRSVTKQGKIFNHRGRRIGSLWCSGSGAKVMGIDKPKPKQEARRRVVITRHGIELIGG